MKNISQCWGDLPPSGFVTESEPIQLKRLCAESSGLSLSWIFDGKWCYTLMRLTGLSQNATVQIKQMLGLSTCHKNKPRLHDHDAEAIFSTSGVFFLNQLTADQQTRWTCQHVRLRQTDAGQIFSIGFPQSPLWCKSIAKMSTGKEWMTPDRASSRLAALAKHDRHRSFVRVAEKNMASLKDRSVSMCVCDAQSLPTRHPLRNNTDVLRLLLLWLTSFKLKLLVSLHHLGGHHALNLRGERRRRGRNKQAVVHIYRARLQGATARSRSEFHFQNNVRLKFPGRSQLATRLPAKRSVLTEKTMKLPGFIQGAHTAPVKVKDTHIV